jgi:hypothetical protein
MTCTWLRLTKAERSVMAHTCKPSTHKAQAGWSWVQGQSELKGDPVSKNQKTTIKRLSKTILKKFKSGEFMALEITNYYKATLSLILIRVHKLSGGKDKCVGKQDTDTWSMRNVVVHSTEKRNVFNK